MADVADPAARGKLRDLLPALARRRDVGPALHLETTDTQVQFTEISAAIEAMR
jgi:hypothetical protein